MTVTERIDAVLKEKGMSRRQLAIDSNIPPSSLQAAMARGRNMTVEMLMAVADALGVSTDFLLGLSDEPTTDPLLRSVCKFTGLSAEAATFLHDYKHSFITHLIEFLVQDKDIVNEVPKLLLDSAQAQALSIATKSVVDKKETKSSKCVAKISKTDGCQYTIKASDAAMLFRRQALELTTAGMEEVLDGIREDMKFSILEMQESETGYFNFVELDADEGGHE